MSKTSVELIWRWPWLLMVIAMSGCGQEVQEPPTAVTPVAELAPALAPLAGERQDYVAVLIPAEAADLAPRFAGELEKVHVRAGDEVELDALIAEVDPRQLRDELAVARAAFQSARALLRGADVDVADAERTVAAEERAIAAGTSPQRVLEDARFELRRAVAARERARASVAEERARLDQVESRLTDANITAPFAGTVAIRYRDPGAVVGPGAPVVRLIGRGGLRVRFAVPASDVATLPLGTSIRVRIPGSDEPAMATVKQIAPELDPASRMIFVEAELDASAADRADLSPGSAAWAMRGQ